MNNTTEIDKIGIYQILNKINGKLYIGSTSESFRKRFNLHKYHLRNDKHKNSHLQYAWNKYGEESFEFSIIEISEIKEEVLDREQYYIDSFDFENLYNINPFASGGLQFDEETLAKRAKTLSKLNKDRSDRYILWKNEILSNENLSEIEMNLFNLWKNRKPWNKGLKYESTDHLKVPKKKKGDRSNDIETKRNNAPEIEVYKDNILLGIFRSAKDLEEFSLTDECKFNVESRFKGEERMGTPSRKLRAPNINVSCRTGKPYKGLIFKFKCRETAPLIGDNQCESDKNGRR